MESRHPPDSPADPGLAPRIARHREIEAELLELGDEALLRWLSDPGLRDRGRAALSLPRGGAGVFVKLLPLTALELEPRHRHSTANLFRLPARYHYRLGSCGFGAWRELEVHRIASRWVLSGECPRFPLLHGWRILPIVSRGPDDKRTMEPWGGDPAIRRRVSSIAEATSSAALFLERFPLTAGRWIRDRPPAGLDGAGAVREAEAALLEPLAFMNGRGLLHMDPHLENILADGGRFFPGDFGLAIARSFDLDPEELRFLESHGNFDRCTAVTGLVQALVARHAPGEDGGQALRGLMDGTRAGAGAVPVAVRTYLSRRGPLALAMGDFYRRLAADLGTEYPASSLQGLLDAV